MQNATCYELIDRLTKAETLEDIHSVCSTLCHESGFDHFIYGARLPTSLTKPYFIFVSGYPTEWRSRYVAQGYMRVDPTVLYCANHLTPVNWDRVIAEPSTQQAGKQFMHEARDFGLRSGASFPVHTAQGEFAMLSLSSAEEGVDVNKRIGDILPQAQLFAMHVHETARRICKDSTLQISQAHLTDREQQCLLWVADGKTTWEASKILNISERTVIYHLQNAVEKLQVKSRQHAVAKAISLGLIAPQLG